MYRDVTGWTIHRKRAWAALMNGCHYDYIDFSITVSNESGTAASQKGIRAWMDHLSRFIETVDYTHAKPDSTWISRAPGHLVVSGLSAGNNDFIAYLADGREVTDPSAGDAITGTVALTLPPGEYEVWLYSPKERGVVARGSGEGWKQRGSCAAVVSRRRRCSGAASAPMR